MALHSAGRLDEALPRYNKILKKEPGNFLACLMAGLLRIQTNHIAEGIILLKRAVVLNPGSVEARANLGIALRAEMRYEEALTHLDGALALDGSNAALHVNRAATLQALGRNEDAVASYDQALALLPENSEAWYQRGLALHAIQRNEEALVSYDRALEHADDPETHYNRGLVLQELGSTAEALAAYDRALSLHPEFPAALNNRGNLLVACSRYDEAMNCLNRCIAMHPNFAEAHNNLALALSGLGHHMTALTCLERALTLAPDYVEAHLNKSTVLLALARPEDALNCLQQAERLAPTDPVVHHNFGIVLHALNRLEEAQSHYRRALDSRPDYAEAGFHLSLTQLLQGDFENGWSGYELRWNIRGAPPRRIVSALWSGNSPLARKRIVVWCEQGLGDTIQFCRYVPLLKNMGASVILEAPAEFTSLAKSLAGVDKFVVQGDSLPAFDSHCPLLSLPRAFDTRLDTIPSTTPYLSASPEQVAQWKLRIGITENLKIGIVAAGNPRHKNDLNRSMALEVFSALIQDGVSVHLLQKECRPADESHLQATPAIRDLRPWLTDISETAAAIECMDLIISVDTSVAHLAGALGKPVWILLPFNPDWRWLMDRSDCPWYPTARLFRQPTLGDWSAVIRSVHRALQDFIARR